MMPVCLFICVCSVCAKPIFFSLIEKLLIGSGKVYNYFGEIASIFFFNYLGRPRVSPSIKYTL